MQSSTKQYNVPVEKQYLIKLLEYCYHIIPFIKSIFNLVKHNLVKEGKSYLMHGLLTIGLRRLRGLGAITRALVMRLAWRRWARAGWSNQVLILFCQCLRWCALGIIPLPWAGMAGVCYYNLTLHNNKDTLTYLTSMN